MLIKDKKSANKGNALFLVLIAVALFAALSYAVTISGRGTGAKTDQRERNNLLASELISYGNSIKMVLENMRLLKGVSDLNNDNYGVLFSAPRAHSGYGVFENQPKTEIFHHQGGGVLYQFPNEAVCVNPSECVYDFTGQINIRDIGRNDRAELAMIVLGLKEDVCRQINFLTGHGWDYIPQGASIVLNRFSGQNYGELGGGEINLSGSLNELEGKYSFCYQEDSGARRYVFVHVINAR